MTNSSTITTRQISPRIMVMPNTISIYATTILYCSAGIKKEAPKTSVIVLSERQDKDSEIAALKAGADDFIRKPLDYDILFVRIEAKLRFGVSNIIEIEELIINPEEEKIIYQGEEIDFILSFFHKSNLDKFFILI